MGRRACRSAVRISDDHAIVLDRGELRVLVLVIDEQGTFAAILGMQAMPLMSVGRGMLS